MRPDAWKSSALLALAAVSLLPGGCVLAPHGAKEEAASLELAGEPYEKPFEERELPELPAEPTSDDVLRARPRTTCCGGRSSPAERWRPPTTSGLPPFTASGRRAVTRTRPSP